MKTRMLRDIEVSEIGMGCMVFSHGYGKIPAEEYSIAAIQNAYEHGCTLYRRQPANHRNAENLR